MECAELSSVASGNAQWQSHLENGLAACFCLFLKLNIEYDAAIPLLVVYPRKTKACPKRNLDTNVYGSNISNGCKLRITQKFINWYMNKLLCVHVKQYYSAIKKTTDITWMNLKSIILKAGHKRLSTTWFHTQYYRKGKAIDQKLPGARHRIFTAEKPKITFWEMEMFYILIIVRCYTTVYIWSYLCSKSLNCALKVSEFYCMQLK